MKPTTREDQVTFRLRFVYRFDEEVRAFVAYVPKLEIFAQAPIESDLREAVRKVSLRFLLTCADMRILDDIMHSSSMTQVSSEEAEQIRANETAEFVSISGYEKECDVEIELPLPFKSELEQVSLK